MDTNQEREEMIQKALRTGGFIFPQTPEEVEDFEKQIGNTDIILPEQLQNLDFMNADKNTVNSNSSEVVESSNFAMAAREGSEIPEDILEKMKFDRAAFKRNKNK